MHSGHAHPCPLFWRLEALRLEVLRLEALRLEALRLDALRLEALRLEALIEAPPWVKIDNKLLV